jgi:predicted TIM-barrel fold metal-dependent hydrolase
MFSKDNKDQRDWLKLIDEEVVRPEIPIIDPHHHLWPSPSEANLDSLGNRYLLEDLWEDTEIGHKIIETVFVECGQGYYENGPEEMKPVGETEFVVSVSKEASEDNSKAQIGGIVSYADMMLGSSVKEVLEAHQEKGEGLFKGIRHAAGWDKSNKIRNSHTNPIEHIYLNNEFQRGIEELSNLNLTFDAWHYHNQITELTFLANNFPDLVIIHDHFGGPLGIGPYTNMREEIFHQWKEDISELSLCKNVFMKLGGLAMPINGWNWHKRNIPASSNEIVELHSPYYLHAINEFGTDRCMFESNFPVDKQSMSYLVLWNGFKKISQIFSDVEIGNLFFETAKKVYSL